VNAFSHDARASPGNGVPIVLTSGYADWNAPEKWRGRPRLQKPCTLNQVEQALTLLLSD
jgi:hypothetical protein